MKGVMDSPRVYILRIREECHPLFDPDVRLGRTVDDVHFPFTAVLEIALSTRRVCVLQMQSWRYLSPLLTKKLLYVTGFLQVCLTRGQYTIL